MCQPDLENIPNEATFYDTKFDDIIPRMNNRISEIYRCLKEVNRNWQTIYVVLGVSFI